MADVIELSGRRKPNPAAAPNGSDQEIVRRDQAIARLRAIEGQIQAGKGALCLLAMDAGDVLQPINATIEHGKWRQFVLECGLSLRTS